MAKVDQDAGVTSSRMLALDYGTVRIGVAISDELGVLAHTRPVIPSQPEERALRRIAAMVAAEQVGLVLLGLPRNMDGTLGRSALRVRKFAQALRGQLSCPIRFIDERRSTILASQLLRDSGVSSRDQKARVDSAAAAVLLQAHLDLQGRHL